jgi:hypothetical protein
VCLVQGIPSKIRSFEKEAPVGGVAHPMIGKEHDVERMVVEH